MEEAIQIAGKSYELIEDHKSGWNAEAFRERYSEILDRYDYIVGDWGYSQLRLKGFWDENHARASKDNCLSAVKEYLIEHCNFGCAYFILKRIRPTNRQPSNQHEQTGARS